MSRDVSRREFLENLAAGAALGAELTVASNAETTASAARATLPHRVLGQTGVKVSILAFGCGSRFLMYPDEEQALAALNRAIDRGITYVDTAFSYGDGKSETLVGKVMATRRKEVFLATKIPDRTRDDFMRRFEASLKRLQVDHVDLLHIHSLGRADDLTKIEGPGGTLKGLYEAREQKMTRFIGMTSHTDGAVLAQAIERHDLNCTQMALNASRNGRFEELALPAANKKKLGIIAMKVAGQEFLLGNAPGKTDIDSLLRYSMSLPVTTAVVGMPRLEFLDHNIEVARNYSPLNQEEMERLRRDLEPSRVPLEKKLVGHLDGPTRKPELFCA
jgi:aryl-alcohol dehydrogenase-like predicted oxidoreductase